MTIPSNRICFTTDNYRKLIILSHYYRYCIYPCIALSVSFVNTFYNITEGTELNITLLSSRTFSTAFIMNISVSLLSALGKYCITFKQYMTAIPDVL